MWKSSSVSQTAQCLKLEHKASLRHLIKSPDFEHYANWVDITINFIINKFGERSWVNEEKERREKRKREKGKIHKNKVIMKKNCVFLYYTIPGDK